MSTPSVSPSLPPPSAFRSFLARVVRFCGTVVFRLCYRLHLVGETNIPATGGVLLLPNHITWIDAVILQIACPRPIRFLIFDAIYRHPVLNPILRLFETIPISPAHAKEGLRAASERLQAGEVVCVFPEGELSRTGTLLRLKKGFEIIARKGGAPVVPVWMDQLWGSIFSFEGGQFFRKWPKRFPYPVTVAFGEPLPAEKADVATVRERLLDLGEATYELRPALRRNLAEACVRGLKNRPGQIAVIDGLDHSTLTRGMLLAVAAVFSKEIRRRIPAKRVGIVLPPSKGAVIANLAVLMAGKVPVSLNFTSGRAALESAMSRAEIDTVITANLVQRKMESFPWPQNVLKLDELLPPLKTAHRLVARRGGRHAVVGFDPAARVFPNSAGTRRPCCSLPAAVQANQKALSSATATSWLTSRSSA